MFKHIKNTAITLATFTLPLSSHGQESDQGQTGVMPPKGQKQEGWFEEAFGRSGKQGLQDIAFDMGVKGPVAALIGGVLIGFFLNKAKKKASRDN